MTTEKKFTFSAQDTGVSAAFDKLRAKQKELSGDIIRNAQQYSQSAKEQLKYIEDQIKAIERKNRLEFEGRKVLAGQQFNADPRTVYGGMRERTEARSDYESKITAISAAEKEGDLSTKLLRELIETVKLSAKDEIRENKRAVEQELKAGVHPGKVEDALKQDIQRDLLAKKEKPESVFQSVLLANLITEAFKKISNVGGVFAGAQTEAHAMAGLLGQVPLVGFLGSAYGRHVEENLSATMASNRLRGITGRGNMTGLNDLGLSMSDTSPIMAELARAKGGNSNLLGGTRDIVSLMKAFGLDQGSLMQQVGTGRFATGGVNPIGDVSTIINLMKSKGVFKDGDMSRLNELLNTQNALMNNQGKVLEKVDKSANAQVIAAFHQIGGSFGNDPRAMERILKVDDSLRSPSNDYQKAMNFAVLAKANPGASYLQLLKEQDKGMAGKGFLSGTLHAIEGQFGGGEAGILALMQRTGLSAGQSETLFRGFQKNRGAFDNIGSQKDLNDVMRKMGVTTQQDIYNRASGNVTGLEKSQAEITDAFVKGMTDGLITVAEKVGGKIGEYIIDALKVAGIYQISASPKHGALPPSTNNTWSDTDLTHPATGGLNSRGGRQ